MWLNQKLLMNFIKKFDERPFLVEMGGKEFIVGKGEPTFEVKVNKPIKTRALAASTSIALGEAYMRGDIDIKGDLYTALNNFLGQLGKFSMNAKKLKRIMFTSLEEKKQKEQVSAHYDIGNDFYALWLDETMSYSCGYFKHEDDSLYEAQMNKIYHILDKLYLSEGMSLLDIGCGWGQLLIEAARTYKVKGMGITLSEEQYRKCQERAREEGLEDYLDFRLMDYRDLPECGRVFDRIVSVGMMEHVGRENYDLFMSCADKALKPSGLFLLHYISGMKECPGDAWMRKYIFPGGMLPSLREVINLCAEHDFHTIDVESLRRHYRNTLLLWDKNFNAHREEIEAKMGKEFARMWDLYLCSCAATFNRGVIDLHQILVSKHNNNHVPMVRWF